jgi:stearoyl-CoA desaturase (delta-9 desaturase)
MASHSDDIIYPSTVPFLLVHLACLGAIWTGVTPGALLAMVALYVVRMWGVTAGYHRYFSHRSFKTSRWFQFVLAFLAQSTTQKSVLWWGALHRHHHRHSDTPEDIHSPRQDGFWYAHMGWIFSRRNDQADLSAVPDLTRYPELRFLHRFEQLPAVVLAVACYALGGWTGLVVGFFWSTVLLYHGTFFINSLAHVHGRVRYVTGDDSRNNWWLAIITLGEGWHNNHHAYQRSVRQGFRWYEFDPTWYVLEALSWLGVVWELGAPPADVVRNERPLGRATLEKVARQLAASFAAGFAERFPDAHFLTREALAARLPSMPTMPSLPSMPSLPPLPSREELAARARELFDGHTVSFDDIVARAHELLAEWRAAAERGAAGDDALGLQPA